MILTQSQISSITAQIMSRIYTEINQAQISNTVGEFLSKYGITIEEEAVAVDKNRSKILVLGALSGKLKDYQLAAKKLGIPSDNIEFVNDYHDLKNFNVGRLRYNSDYSDIIYGPSPHKQVGMGDTSSMLAEIKKNPSQYPKLHEACANGCLKITMENFRRCISGSRYLAAN